MNGCNYYYISVTVEMSKERVVRQSGMLDTCTTLSQTEHTRKIAEDDLSMLVSEGETCGSAQYVTKV